MYMIGKRVKCEDVVGVLNGYGPDKTARIFVKETRKEVSIPNADLELAPLYCSSCSAETNNLFQEDLCAECYRSMKSVRSITSLRLKCKEATNTAGTECSGAISIKTGLCRKHGTKQKLVLSDM